MVKSSKILKEQAQSGQVRFLKQIRPNKQANNLPQDEWDISTCPPKERYECFLWELARNCNAIKKDVLELRANCRENTFDAIWKQLGRRIFQSPSRRPMAIFYFSPEFPNLPYLSIGDSKERNRRISLAFGDDKKAAGKLLDGRFDLVPHDIGQRINAVLKTTSPVYRVGGSHELALLSICWQQPDAWLKEAFTQWLIANRPNDVEPWKDRGAGVPNRKFKHKLKQLGAWRLLQKMNWKEAATHSAKTSGNAKPLFEEQKEWNDAETIVAQWIHKQDEFHRS